MKRNFRLVTTVMLSLCLVVLSSTLYAGTTGKIAGRVTDASTGEPLPGVNVIVSNTSMGSATDMEGNFSIINIPPGEYSIRVSMMGYATQNIENLLVKIDLTTPINAKLSEEVIEGEEVTIVAERPIVQMDMTGSMSTVSAKEMEATPAQSVNAVLELQAGVINAGGIHIRGGRSGEVAYWVDGVATTDAYSYSNTAAIENSAVQELQVISGTFNAEYGQAMSGIINIITKDGEPNYHGQLKGYVGDYISNDDLYNVMKSYTPVYNEDGSYVETLTEGENPLKSLNPIYNAEASLSGPIPGFGGKLTFFTNARYYQQEGYLYGRDWYLPSGIPGDSALVPMNPNQRLSGLAKLTWKMTPSVKVSYSFNGSGWENERGWSRNYKYNPYGTQMSKGETFTHLLKLNHTLSSKTFYELKINHSTNRSEGYVHKDLITPSWLISVPADSLNDAYTFDPYNAANEMLLDSLQSYGLITNNNWVPNPDNPNGYVHQDSATAPVGYSFLRAGNSLGQYERETSYWIGKFDMTSQINHRNQVKLGVEARLHQLSLDTYTLQGAMIGDTSQEVVPFVPVVPKVSSIYRDKYTYNPMEISAYIQDKIELRDLIINAGLRFDYFNSDGVIPASSNDINIYAPFVYENIYNDFDRAAYEALPKTDRESYLEGLTEYTPEQRRAFMHKKAEAKMQVSPRLGIAYPITDKGVIHFSYGHFFQIPQFQYLYQNKDFVMSTGGGQTMMGNADLSAQRTTQYEIGLQQQIGQTIGIDVTIFYRDIRDWVGAGPLIKTAKQTVSYSTFENKDYANVRGITFKMEKRYTHNFMAKVDYSLQWVEGTYSNPTDAFTAQVNSEEPALKLIPLNWDQRHTLNAQFVYDWHNWTASLIGKYKTGLPYTPSFAVGEMVGGSALSALPENSARLPEIASLDLYLTKRWSLHKFQLTAFLYAYNLLDNRAATSVFSDTGSAEYTTDPFVDEVPFVEDRISTVQDYYTRPEMYIAPRQIQLGLTIGF